MIAYHFFPTCAVQAAVLLTVFVRGRLRLYCSKLRKVYVLNAVNTVLSLSSRYICGFLRFSPQRIVAWLA